MFNAVFEETLGILNMHFISKNGQNSKICYGTYFLHITLKLTAKNMIFLCVYQKFKPTVHPIKQS